ncbi:DsbA family protein [Nocardioides cynanchi]|uniref:DsbA family protein n=1 Tax=Nocardioides cynanchi TaxID=2558918 RepID=UPI00177E4440|nr:thioredoxin domain-containing protein [Nocardioides cynanchi]
MSTKNQQQSRAERARRAQSLMREQQRRERSRNLMVVGAVVGALLVIVGVLFYVQSKRDTTGQAAGSVPGNLTGGYSVTVGQASAPTTLKLYEDFLCPICGEFEAATSAQVDAAIAAGKLKVDYHMAGFLDPHSTNAYSSRALNAAAVVLDTSGPEVFLTFHNLLYQHQPAEGGPGPSDDQLIAYAVQAGAQESAVAGPIRDKVYAQWVLNANDQMSKDGVVGTPTVFINGQQQDPTNPAAAAQAVLAAIK